LKSVDNITTQMCYVIMLCHDVI